MNKMNNLAVSAPYLAIISSGSTVFPFDLDIFAPSLSTMPCVSKLANGSRTVTSPRSAKTIWKKRAYSKM